MFLNEDVFSNFEEYSDAEDTGAVTDKERSNLKDLDADGSALDIGDPAEEHLDKSVVRHGRRPGIQKRSKDDLNADGMVMDG